MLKPPPLPCDPPAWAQGGHLQTVLGHFLPSRVLPPSWEGLRLPLGDGDALAVRLARGTSSVVVHLFHGLGGSADADYMRRSATLFASQGHTVLAANHRGAGEGRGLAARPYHMGCTTDMAAVLAHGRRLFPDRTHVAVGFSLSATVLLLLLGRDARAGLASPDLAIAVNPPVDLERCSRRLLRGFNRAYDLRFVGRLRNHVAGLGKAGLLERPLELPLLATLREFDEAYTAPAAGFRDRSDYYARCSCGPHLGGIQIPTVLITSRDDPFAPAGDLDGARWPARLHLHVEDTGGHMGYVGRGVPGRRWLDYALAHYLGELLGVSPAPSEQPGGQGGDGGLHAQDARP